MWLCRRRELRRKQGLRRLRRSYRWGIREKRRPGGGPGCGGDGCEKWLRVDGRLRACRFETLTEAREFIPGKVNFASAVTVRGRPPSPPLRDVRPQGRHDETPVTKVPNQAEINRKSARLEKFPSQSATCSAHQLHQLSLPLRRRTRARARKLSCNIETKNRCCFTKNETDKQAD